MTSHDEKRKDDVAPERLVTFGGAEATRGEAAADGPSAEVREAASGGPTAAADEATAAHPEEAASAPAKRRAPRRAAVAAIAAACVVLCVLGAAFALGGTAAFETVDDTAAPTQGVRGSAAQDADAARGSASSEADATAESEASTAAQDVAGDAAANASADAPANEADANAANAASAADPAAPAAAAPEAAGASDAGSAPSPSADPSGTAPAPSAPAEEQPTAPAVRTVSVSIDATAAGGGTVFEGTIELRDGMTAYDVLEQAGVSYNASSSAFGMYVSAIAGFAEKDHGPESGWKYSVNGTVPQMSASSYVLQAGDTVRWFYALTA